MTIHTNLNRHKVLKVNNHASLYVEGKIWTTNENLCSTFNTTDFDAISWKKEVAKLSGFYSIVYKDMGNIYAAVDKIRSIPLFYSYIEGCLYLSNSSEWIRSKIEIDFTKIDPQSKDEFIMLGYVLGSKTLYPEIKQLKAGELLTYVDGSLEISQYYQFGHKEPHDFNKSDFMKNLGVAAINSTKRLIDFAAGRQIIVPLSGGYDSRLIISLLKKLGHENVICFSYGVSNNKEAVFSKEIAESLGYKWIFIEYTEKQWKQSWSSNKAEYFRKYSSNHSSLPHVQDWLALETLASHPDVNDNAVFVPGHCCVTGYLPKSIYRLVPDNESYAKNIIATHFTGRPFAKNTVLTLNNAREILTKDKHIRTHEELASEIIRFNWQERQAKYITNSIRAYEFFGFSWWLPLWDDEFMNIWHSVPLNYRLNRLVYIDFVNTLFKSQASNISAYLLTNANEKNKIIRLFNKKAKSIIKNALPKSASNLLLYRRIKKSYESHFLKFGSLIKESDKVYYIRNNYSLLGMYSELFLKNKWGKLDD